MQFFRFRRKASPAASTEMCAAPEPDTSFSYLDQTGRIWEHDTTGTVPGWRVGDHSALFTWFGACLVHKDAFPLMRDPFNRTD